MEEALYHLHYQQEESHWWFAARSMIVRRVIDKLGHLKPGDTILDVGCGTGAILAQLARTYRVIGIDLSPLAVEYSRKRGLTEIFQMPVQAFPKDTYSVRAATLLDVIEHIEDDVDVLKSVADLVGQDGRVIITVPAHMWMWGSHDVANHHVRRYSKRTLRESLDKAGLEPVLMTYYNSILFPLGVIRKWLDRKITVENVSQNLTQPGPLLNGLLKTIFAFERFLVTWLPLPFGISLLVVARRKRST